MTFDREVWRENERKLEEKWRKLGREYLTRYGFTAADVPLEVFNVQKLYNSNMRLYKEEVRKLHSWLHRNTKAPKRQLKRKPKLKVEKTREILNAFAAAAGSVCALCQVVGIHRRSYYMWYKKGMPREAVDLLASKAYELEKIKAQNNP